MRRAYFGGRSLRAATLMRFDAREVRLEDGAEGLSCVVGLAAATFSFKFLI
jgi:hypothetical protein